MKYYISKTPPNKAYFEPAKSSIVFAEPKPTVKSWKWSLRIFKKNIIFLHSVLYFKFLYCLSKWHCGCKRNRNANTRATQTEDKININSIKASPASRTLMMARVCSMSKEALSSQLFSIKNMKTFRRLCRELWASALRRLASSGWYLDLNLCPKLWSKTIVEGQWQDGVNKM